MNDTADSSPTAEDSVEVIRQALARAHGLTAISPAPVQALWGLIWLVAFGFTHWASQVAPWTEERAGVAIGLTWLVLGVAGSVFSFLYFARAAGPRSGVQQSNGSLLAIAMAASFTGAAALPLVAGLTDHLVSAVIVLVVAVVYVVTGAVYGQRGQVWLGVWILATNLVATALGGEWYSLVMAIAGGGALLAFGLATWPRGTRRAVATS